jgi:hypothetical protein
MNVEIESAADTRAPTHDGAQLTGATAENPVTVTVWRNESGS